MKDKRKKREGRGRRQSDTFQPSTLTDELTQKKPVRSASLPLPVDVIILSDFSFVNVHDEFRRF